jgi:hypothetical protein
LLLEAGESLFRERGRANYPDVKRYVVDLTRTGEPLSQVLNHRASPYFAVVEYALQNIAKPTGVSTHRVTPELPAPIRKELPRVEDLQVVLTKLLSEIGHLRQERQNE